MNVSTSKEKRITIESMLINTSTGKSKNEDLLRSVRPFDVNKKRDCKEIVYSNICSLLKKHKIFGAYAGLGASYIPEIYNSLSPHISGFIHNFEIKKDFYEKLKYYDVVVNESIDVETTTFKGDILEGLLRNSRYQYSIIDLDLMCTLTFEKIDSIIKATKQSLRDRGILIVWSAYGRNITENYYNSYSRPLLTKRLAASFNIIEHKPFKYRDNRIPMKVEVFVLKRK